MGRSDFRGVVGVGIVGGGCGSFRSVVNGEIVEGVLGCHRSRKGRRRTFGNETRRVLRWGSSSLRALRCAGVGGVSEFRSAIVCGGFRSLSGGICYEWVGLLWGVGLVSPWLTARIGSNCNRRLLIILLKRQWLEGCCCWRWVISSLVSLVASSLGVEGVYGVYGTEGRECLHRSRRRHPHLRSQPCRRHCRRQWNA